MTFEEFVDARLGALLRYATVVAWDRHLAEDVVQEVLARAHLRWERIARLDAPERYVKRMIVNEYLSWRRRRSAAPVPPESLEAFLPPLPDPTERADAQSAMVRLIGGLPANQRTAIALRFYEDLSIDEIAELMGTRASTVRTHLARALATLRVFVTLPAGQEVR